MARARSADLRLSGSEGLSSRQAHEAAYRLVARYYEYERVGPIFQMLQVISATGEDEARNERIWEAWKVCVQETLDESPLPELPPPWDT